MYFLSKKKLTLVVNYSTDIIMFIILLLSLYDGSQALNDFAMGIFCLFLLNQYIINSKEMVISLTYLFTICIAIVSAFYIEFKQGVFLYEISEYSGFENIFIKYLFIQYFSVRILLLFIKNTNKNINKKLKLKYLFLFLFFIILVVTYIIILKNGSSFLYGMDRFTYEREILGNTISKFTNLLMYFALGLGLLYFNTKNKVYILLFLLDLITFILKGHKFGNLFYMTLLFLIPSVFYNPSSGKYLLKRFILLIIFFVSLALLINNIYSKNSKLNPIIYLESRLMQQNQLWWAVVKNDNFSSIHLNNIKNEFQYSFYKEKSLKYNIGIYKVMELTTPRKILRAKILSHSRYTEGLYPLLYYYFNYYILLIVALVISLLIVIIYRFVILSITSGNLFLTIISTRLVYILQTFLTGDIFKIFSIEILIEIFIFTIYLSAKRRKKNV